MSGSDQPERHAPGKRILREATPAERERHATVRAAIETERPGIIAWAREESAQVGGQTAVGTMLTPEEIPILDAIDAYAASHNLPSRSAVVREALSRLLDVHLDVEPRHSA